jgi:hypothetical protein
MISGLVDVLKRSLACIVYPYITISDLGYFLSNISKKKTQIFRILQDS